MKVVTMRSRRTCYSVPGALLACAVALALVAALLPAGSAQAYFNFGTVSVSTGSSSLSVAAGSSVSTSVTVSPTSDEQTEGCGMAKCPQVCSDDDVAEAGYTCFDANGQCTCAGKSYSTYYTEISASSSNSSVATATVSGGTLTVKGVSAGTATITVTGSLRQWTDGASTVSVTVTQASSSSSGSSGSGSSSASSGSSGSSGSSSSSGSSKSSKKSGSSSSSSSGSSSDSSGSSSSDDTISILEEADTTDSTDDELNETVVKTVAGTVYTVEINDYLVTSDEFAKLERKKDQLIMWAGPSSTAPDYSWTYTKADVDVDSAYVEYDPEVDISSLGTGNVANIMEQSAGGMVLAFAHSGQLPGTATIYANADGYFADGSEVGLYCFDEDEKRFELVEEGVEVVDGYVSFAIDHCSTWALSADDLTAYEVQEANTPGAAASSAASDEGADGGGMGAAAVVLALAALVVIAAVVAAIVLRRRRGRAQAGAAEPAADADETSDDGAEGPAGGEGAAETDVAPAAEDAAPAAEDVATPAEGETASDPAPAQPEGAGAAEPVATQDGPDGDPA